MDGHYLTQTDATITVIRHPGTVTGVTNRTSWDGYVIDAAHFTLTGGRAPIHIWNYARRGALDESGGAMFDDTALANEFGQLQLVINRERYLEAAVLFAPQTHMGDLQIRYTDAAGRPAGYTLYNGHVGQAAEEVTTANGMFMSVMLMFSQVVPLGWTPPAAFDQAALPLGYSSISILPYHAEYELGSAKRQYHPVLARKDRREATDQQIDVLTKVHRGVRQTIAGTVDTVREMSFIGAFIETLDEQERQLFIWNQCTQQYLAIARADAAKNPIIDEDGYLTELAARLLGRSVLGREAFTSLDNKVLKSADEITLLVNESVIGC